MSQPPTQIFSELKTNIHNLLQYSRPPLTKAAALQVIETLIDKAYEQCANAEDRSKLTRLLSLTFHPDKRTNNPFAIYFSGELLESVQQIINKIKTKHEESFINRPSFASAYAAFKSLIPSLEKNMARYGTKGHGIAMVFGATASSILFMVVSYVLFAALDVVISALFGPIAPIFISASMLTILFSSYLEPYRKLFLNWLTEGEYAHQLEESDALEGFSNMALLIKSFYISITKSQNETPLSFFVLKPLKFLGAAFIVLVASIYETMKMIGKTSIALLMPVLDLLQLTVLTLLNLPLFVMDLSSFVSRKFQEFTRPQPVNNNRLLIQWNQDLSLFSVPSVPSNEENPRHYPSVIQTFEGRTTASNNEDVPIVSPVTP